MATTEETLQDQNTPQEEPTAQTEPQTPPTDTEPTSTEPTDITPDTEAQLAAEKDKYIRLAAEFDNYRKRTVRERLDLIQTAAKDTIEAILPVVDDFERGLEALKKDVEAGKVDASVAEGMQLIYDKLMHALTAQGVTEIVCKGEVFDGEIHEAVTRFNAGEDLKGKIVDVVQKGYRLRDKMLRFPKVVVGE